MNPWAQSGRGGCNNSSHLPPGVTCFARECGDEKRLSREPTEPEVGIVDEVLERFKTGAEEDDAIAA